MMSSRRCGPQATSLLVLRRRDHSIADGLDYVAAWNSAQLVSADYVEVFEAMRQKRRPIFSSKM